MLRTKCNSMHLLYIYPSIYLYAPLVYVQVYFLFIASHSSLALCIHQNILFVHHNNIYPLMYTFKYRKHCQRHNGPKGWVPFTKVTLLGHITSSYTNLDQTSSKSWPSTNLEISIKHQHFDKKNFLTKPSFRISTKIELHNHNSKLVEVVTVAHVDV